MINFFFYNQLYSKIKSVNLNLLLFFIFIVIIFIKSPCTFFLGRSINGMEVYFYNALNNHFWHNLIYVYSEGKYFELWTNLSAIIHSQTNLSLRLIDVYMALVIKIALIYYIFFSHSEFLITTFSRFIFASFSIYSTAVTPEIWLISLHSKNFFGIVSFLMLFQNFTNFDKKNFFVYRFPREVREIYYDNKKNKNIYGTASLKERLELEEEGIELASIPWIESNKDN